MWQRALLTTIYRFNVSRETSNGVSGDVCMAMCERHLGSSLRLESSKARSTCRFIVLPFSTGNSALGTARSLQFPDLASSSGRCLGVLLNFLRDSRLRLSKMPSVTREFRDGAGENTRFSVILDWRRSGGWCCEAEALLDKKKFS